MHGKFPLRSHSRPVSMSAEDLATDAKVSEKDVEGIVEPVVGSQNKGNAFTTTRLELWAFYVYYIVSLWLPGPSSTPRKQILILPLRQGNNGLSGFNFGPSQLQNLLYLAGYDPAHAPFTVPCSSDSGCVLPYLGEVRDGERRALVLISECSPLGSSQ